MDLGEQKMIYQTEEQQADHKLDLLLAELGLRIRMQMEPISYWEQGSLLYSIYKDRFTKNEIESIIDNIWDTWDRNDEYIDVINKFIRENYSNGERSLGIIESFKTYMGLFNKSSEVPDKKSSAS